MAVEVVAEIAQGYEGNPKLAQLLVKSALVAGADAVKIQIIYAEELCTPNYQHYNFFRQLEMSDATWGEIIAPIKAAKKKVYFDVYGDMSLGLAERLGANGVKISTTDFFNTPLAKKAFEKFETVFVSVGGISTEDLDEFMSSTANKKKVVLMHGFQSEPTLTEDNNLLRIQTLRSRYGVRLGFMDHSLGTADEAFYLPVMALGQGISHLEKHISLDNILNIEDSVSALSPTRFEELVKVVRLMEPALGSAELKLTPKEIEYKNRAGKVVVARNELVAGTTIREEDLVLKRVGNSSPEKCFAKMSQVVGRKLKNPVKTNLPIEVESIA